jgi:Tol biopolymer transport system component
VAAAAAAPPKPRGRLAVLTAGLLPLVAAGAYVLIRQTATSSHVQIVPAEGDLEILAATVTPDGNYIDFVRGRPAIFDVWRVPFLGGTPRRLLEGVGTPIGWSPDGTQMAFVERGVGPSAAALVVADADGGRKRTVLTLGEPGGFNRFLSGGPVSAPSWSPDGRLIAAGGFERHSTGFTIPQVFVIDVATGDRQVVPLHEPWPARPSWLDDTSLVVNRQGQLWRVSYPSGHASRITNDLLDYADVSLSGDRRTLVTTRVDGRTTLWVGDAAGTTGQVVLPATRDITGPLAWSGRRILATTPSGIASITPGETPVWEFIVPAVGLDASAEGDAILFTVSEPEERSGTWIANASGQNARQMSSERWNQPLVTPDGRHAVALSSRSGVQSLWLVPLEGGAPSHIVEDFVPGGSFDVSADGRLAFWTPGPRIVVCLLPDCRERREIASPDRGLGRIRWTPDGLGVAMKDPTSTNLIVQPLDGGRARQLTQFPDLTIADFGWSADGTRLAVTRRATSTDIVLLRGLR